MRLRKQFSLAYTLAALVAFAAQSSSAHFVWLTLDASQDQPQAALFFSEAGDIAGEKLPGGVAAAEVTLHMPGKEPRTLSMVKHETTDDEVMLVANVDACDACAVETKCTYGLYHGILLTYYSRAIHATTPEQLASVADSELVLDIIPKLVDGGLKLQVTWEGQPLPSVPVSIVTPSGDELEKKTGSDGVAVIEQREAGLYSFRANHNMQDAPGEFEGESYKQQHHYATVTYVAPAAKPGQPPLEETAAVSPTASADGFALLPEGIASFGGAVLGDNVYVYSGHIGRAHDHSADNLSQSFRRMNLDTKQTWESLPMQTPLQGLALVAHQDKLYRVGGLSASNEAEQDEALKSVAEFACFDPTTNEWSALPDLPGARSSHDAVVVGDHIYVVGGWKLDGDGDDGEWYDSALMVDLSQPKLEWKGIPSPFRRRALAAGTINGKIYALGGMDEMSDIDRGVDVYDPATNEWSKGPELPGDGMDGFGVSAWQMDGELYVSGASGIVYQLGDDGQAWDEIGKLVQGRFFHRLLPLGADRLLAIGGASDRGHLREIETISVAVPEVARN